VARLLFHTYHFPPIGGSGAQRPLKMVQALQALGYESVVVTRSADTRAERWVPEDATLVAEIPLGLEIRRLPDESEPEPTARWRPIAERWLGITDRWTKWWADESFRLGLEAGAEVDLIYVWMQPYASAQAGARLSQALGKPWVADLGDPWALDEMMIFPTALHRRAVLGRMGKLLRTAAGIVLSTPEAVEQLLRRFPELHGRPVVTIPNGYDGADFTEEPAPRRDGKFRIVHTGYLHTELAEHHRRRRLLGRVLGGSLNGVDILTRSHVYLVEAVNQLLTRRPDLEGVLELHLAGVTTDADERVAADCPVAKLHGYVNHADSIQLMQTADLLFLPMQNLPEGVRATIVPGKTYEYLASGTAILAAVPDGDARDILERAGNAILVRPDDSEGMGAAILAELQRSRAGVKPPPRHNEFVARFEYRRLAAELAGVFDAVLGDQRDGAKVEGRTSRSARSRAGTTAGGTRAS
jgi:glycosyltransferase involved in cell wall biosynthesis